MLSCGEIMSPSFDLDCQHSKSFPFPWCFFCFCLEHNHWKESDKQAQDDHFLLKLKVPLRKVQLVTLYLSCMHFEVPPFILNFGQCTKRLWYYVFTVFFWCTLHEITAGDHVWHMSLANNARNGSFYCAKQSMFIINFPRSFLLWNISALFIGKRFHESIQNE